ncbi:MAG TPA: hypothetical protein VGF79_04965 [Bacteroidia bacterium]
MKLLLTVILLCGIANCKATEIEGGLRLQVNSYRFYSSNDLRNKNLSNAISPGLNLQISTSASSFLRASVLYQKRQYLLNYQSGTAAFTQANLTLTETELAFGKYLFSGGQRQGFYLQAGIQTLFRNWGEETYQQDIVPNTYWPQLRVSSMLGAGYSFRTNSGLNVHLGTGINGFISDKMNFETGRHQYFFYILFNGSRKIKNASPMHKKCNQQF